MPSFVETIGKPDAQFRLRDRSRNVLLSLPNVQRMEVALDVLTGALSLILTAFILNGLFSPNMLPGSARHAAAACLLFVCLLVLFLHRSGVYHLTGSLLGLRETACVLKAVTSLFVLVIPCALLFSSHKSIVALLIEAPLLTILLVLEKQLLNSKYVRLQSPAASLQRVLIYGPTSSSRIVFEAFNRSAKLGMRPVAIVPTETYANTVPNTMNTVAESAGELHAATVRAHRADIVLVTDPPTSAEVLERIMDESSRGGARVLFRVAAPLQDYASGVDYLDLDGHVVYGPHVVHRRRMHEVVSRGMDVIVASIALLLLAPVFATVALLVRMDSRGPVLFRQRRVGRDSVLFTILKFRTMREEACGSDLTPSTSNDPRITRVGKILRKTSIDELPQLWNVLRGDMALVGPRPEMPFIVDTYTSSQRERLAVLPGVTGVWQLSEARSQPIHENVHYDMYYLKHRSTFLDIAVLLHTFFFAMRGT